MANEIILSVALNADGTTKSLSDLQKQLINLKNQVRGKDIGSNEFKVLSNEVAKTNQQIQLINKSFKAVDASAAKGSIAQVQQQIKDLDFQLRNLGDDADPKLVRSLETQLVQARSKVQDFKDDVKGMGEERLIESFGKVGVALTGSFSLASQALTKFGADSKSVMAAQLAAEKAIVNILAIKSIAEGVGEGVKLVKIGQAKVYNLLLATENGLQSKNVIVKGAATIAQHALNMAMKANPLLAVIGLLVAVGGALAVFASSTDEAAEKQNILNAALEREQKHLEIATTSNTKYAQQRDNAWKRDIDLIKARGATDEQIAKAEIARRQEQIRWIQNLVKSTGVLTDEQKEQWRNLQNEIDVITAETETKRNDKQKETANKRAEDAKKALEDLKSITEKHGNEVLQIAAKSESDKLALQQQKDIEAVNKAFEKTDKLKAAQEEREKSLKAIQEKYSLLRIQVAEKEINTIIEKLTQENEFDFDKKTKQENELLELKKTNTDLFNEYVQGVQPESPFEKQKKELEAQEQALLSALDSEAADISNQKDEDLSVDELLRLNEIELQKTEIAKAGSEARKEIDKLEFESKLGIAGETAGKVKGIFKQESTAYKLTATVEATIAAYLAASKALASAPPPFNFIQAAAAVGAGLKNVAEINKVKLPFRDGGFVSGPGTSTSDSIDAKLSDGEYVVRAAAVRNNLPLLEAINNTGYAQGGLVNTAFNSSNISTPLSQLNFQAQIVDTRNELLSIKEAITTQRVINVESENTEVARRVEQYETRSYIF